MMRFNPSLLRSTTRCQKTTSPYIQLKPRFNPSRQFTSSSSSTPSFSSSIKSIGYLTATALTFSSLLLINSKFNPDQTLQLEAPSSLPEEPSPSSASAFRLDPATSQPLPLTIPSPTSVQLPSNLQLVGLGVRTVSFLSVRVYVAGLYVDSKALKKGGKLESLPAWKDYSKEKLLSLKGDESEVGKRGEELVAELLRAGIPCVIRIVPVRSTDFQHLRDGFTRSIQSRIKSARKSHLLSEAADQSLNLSIQDLKSIFPKSKLAKGENLDVVFYPSSNKTGTAMALEQEGKVLGKVEALKEGEGFSVGRELLLAYFADKDEISTPFKVSVAEGFEETLSGK